MNIRDTVAVITGATGSIGREIAFELAQRGAHGLAVVDTNPEVRDLADAINQSAEDWVCVGYEGPLKDGGFRREVYREISERCGTVNVCVPAFGWGSPEASLLPKAQLLLVAIDWAAEMLGSFAGNSPCRQTGRATSQPSATGMIFFMQPLCSKCPDEDLPEDEAEEQVRRAASTLATQADVLGVRCAVMLPDVPHLTAVMPPSTIHRQIIEGDMAQPSAVAKAVCFLISPPPSASW